MAEDESLKNANNANKDSEHADDSLTAQMLSGNGHDANADVDQARANVPPEMLSRRDFLTKLSLALGGITGAAVTLPVLGFLFAPLLSKAPDVWRAVGPVDQFKVGETVEVKFEDASPLPWSGIASQTGAWLRRNSEQEFTAYAVNCTHLGCPVRWESGASLFMCPCHGGVYYANGKVAAGPPPLPLPNYNVRVNKGQVEIEATGIPLGGNVPKRLGARG